MYLDEIPAQYVSVSWGRLGTGGLLGYDGENRAVVVGGRRYPHALSAHAPSHLVFALGGRFARFRGAAALNDDARGRVTRANFQVIVDGRSVWTAENVTPEQPPRILDIPVAGACTLE